MPSLKVTPFSVSLPIATTVCIAQAIYFYDFNSADTRHLTSIYCLFYCLGFIIVLTIEQVLIRAFNLKTGPINLTEVLLLLVTFYVLGFTGRTYYFKVENSVQWFGFINSNAPSEATEHYLFPNDRIIYIKRDGIMARAMSPTQETIITMRLTGENWRTFTEYHRFINASMKGPQCVLFQRNDTPTDQEFYDSVNAFYKRNPL
jgi:hypothetical protein